MHEPITAPLPEDRADAQAHAERKKITPLQAAVFISLMILALIVRWIFLDVESLWFDEGWTWWLVSHPAGQMFHFMKADTVAPSYFYLLRGWIVTFGDSEFAIRSLSALLATLALIPWLMLGNRTRLSCGAMLVAFAFIAWSCMQSQYAREARPYALLALSTMTAIACIPIAVRKRSWRAMSVFTVAVTLGMYTHNAMAFYSVCFAAAWLIWPGERSLTGRVIDLALCAVLCAVCYAPWLPVLKGQAQFVDGNFWVDRPNRAQAYVILSTVFGVDVYDTTTLLYKWFGHAPSTAGLARFVTGCFGALCVLACCQRDVAARRRAIALCTIALGPIVIVYELSKYVQPIFLGRLFMTSSMLVPLILALSLDRRRWLPVRIVSAAIAVAMGSLGITSTTSLLFEPQKEDWRGLHDYVTSLPKSDARVIVFMATEGELPYLYYARTPDGHIDEASRHRTGSPGGFFDIDPPRTIRRVKSDADLAPMRKALAEREYDEAVLILSHYQWVDEKHFTRTWFEQNWELKDTKKLRHVIAMTFARKRGG